MKTGKKTKKKNQEVAVVVSHNTCERERETGDDEKKACDWFRLLIITLKRTFSHTGEVSERENAGVKNNPSQYGCATQ